MPINVRAIANASIQSINPDIEAEYLASTGYTTGTSGKREPQYAAAVPNLRVQVQKLDAARLRHIEGLNLQGVFRNVRTVPNVQGVVRVNAQGGDLFRFPERPGGPVRTWLVVQVFETWPTWCSVAVVLQTDA